MCGIFACSPIKDSWLDKSIKEHTFRGPDQSSKFLFKNFGFSVNRLAITGDLENGSQPVSSKSGDTMCIFNGAVFNTDILLKQFSLKPKSRNDAAIILELYEKIGQEFLDYVRGMFSIILIDKKSNSILVSRDILGIKPLFWVSCGDVTIFSSSLQAIPSEHHSSVKAFPPGNVWIDKEFKNAIQQKIAVTKDLESILLEAVKSHIPKEVKWGCALSGGVDSSLLCALAKKQGHNFRCYTLDTGEGEDRNAAIVVSKFLDLELKAVKVDKKDIINALPIVINALGVFDVQMLIGALLTYFVSKAAYEDGLKVMLFGEGADEVFGGYKKYTSLLDSGAPESVIQNTMIRDQKELWLTHNKRVDHASMATSIEARVPFQDSQIIVNARRVPLKFKVDPQHRLRDKILLRAIASKYLPSIIFKRGKNVISQGTSILELVFSAIDEIFPKISVEAEDIKNFNLATKDEKVCFSIWKRFYPNLASSKSEMIKRQLIPIEKKM